MEKSYTYALFNEASKLWQIPTTRNVKFSKEKVKNYLSKIIFQDERNFISEILERTTILNINDVFSSILENFRKFQEVNTKKYYILLPRKFGSESLLIQYLWPELIRDNLFIDFLYNIEVKDENGYPTGRTLLYKLAGVDESNNKVYQEIENNEEKDVDNFLVIDDCIYTGQNINEIINGLNANKNITISIILSCVNVNYYSSFFANEEYEKSNLKLFCDKLIGTYNISDEMVLERYKLPYNNILPLILEHKYPCGNLATFKYIYHFGLIPRNKGEIELSESLLEVEPTRDFILNLELLHSLVEENIRLNNK